MSSRKEIERSHISGGGADNGPPHPIHSLGNFTSKNSPTVRILLGYLENKDKLVTCNKLTNCRPISILPVISKVYEKVFYNRLYDYFSVNNLLSSSQFGFRSGASTEQALLNFRMIF